MTATANLAMTKVEVSQNQKEVTVNEALDVCDAALGGISIALSDANYTLSTASTPQEWQYGVIKFTGALTAARNVIVPDNKKLYVIINATSGGYALTVKTSGGTGIAVSASALSMLYCDGTNVVAVTPGGGVGTVTSVATTQPAAGLTISGGTITTAGTLVFSLADDLAALEALSGTGVVERTGSNTYALRTLDTDGTMAANSATRIPSQSAVVTAIANAVAALVASAPGTLDTLDELAAALGDDANFATTVTTSLGTKVVGPGSATDGYLVLFDGTSGKLVKLGAAPPTGTNTGDETTTTVGALINGATAKTTPVDADFLGLMDSAASNILKKLSWANVKATLKTYFDTLYAPLVQPFCISLFYPGVPGASALVGIVAAPANISTLTFAAAIAGSSGKACTAATAQTDFDVRKNATTNANGTSVGTIRFAAAGTAPTFIAASGFTLTGGSDYLSIWAPASADATLADIGVTLYATR